MKLKNTIRSAVNHMGFDLIRVNNSPRKTLLGMINFNFATVIDVGANRGQFAKEISAFFPKAKVYCFEPLEEPYQELSEWAEKQNGRVRCYKTALGETIGEFAMRHHEEHSPSSSLLAATDICHELYPQTRSEHTTMIQVTTMDHALGDELQKMPRQILLKLDVQGFEDRVLRGGLNILPHCQAVVVEVNVQPLYKAQADFRVITNLLYDAGFQYAGNLQQAYGQNGKAIFLDAVFSR